MATIVYGPPQTETERANTVPGKTATENDNRIQARVPDFHKWIIQELVGPVGRNEADVINRMIAGWIEDYRKDYLAELGLTPQVWLARIGRGPAKVVELPVKSMDQLRKAEMD